MSLLGFGKVTAGGSAVAEPGKRSGGSREEDVEMRRPLPLPPLEQPSNLERAADPTGPGEPLSCLRAAGLIGLRPGRGLVHRG